MNIKQGSRNIILNMAVEIVLSALYEVDVFAEKDDLIPSKNKNRNSEFDDRRTKSSSRIIIKNTSHGMISNCK